MEVDGKPLTGMPPPVPTLHCCVCYAGSGGYPLAVLLGERGCLCCVQHSHKNEHALGEATPRGRVTQRGLWLRGPLAFYMHTKFEVFSFSRFGDMREHKETD